MSKRNYRVADVIRTTNSLEDGLIPVGVEGTVQLVLDENRRKYLVEFDIFDSAGNNMFVVGQEEAIRVWNSDDASV